MILLKNYLHGKSVSQIDFLYSCKLIYKCKKGYINEFIRKKLTKMVRNLDLHEIELIFELLNV